MVVAMDRPMTQRVHVALLGDSIFDNAAYTRGEPDVVSHLRRLLPGGGRATLCAVDGATTHTVATQLDRVPPDATHLVVAIGGNDALQNSDLLALPVRSSAQALHVFADRLQMFEQSYRTAVRRLVARGPYTAVCTVYNGALEPERARIARVGLTLFNDVILRTAIDLRLDALELRSICTDPADYANPIEPSGVGGAKIAHGIARLVGAMDVGRPPARVWGSYEP
jgi:GDSL-like Lipase/Acylhydrolase family